MRTSRCQRWRAGRASYRPAREVIDPSHYFVAEVGELQAKRFIQRHHYSHSYPASRRRFAMWDLSGRSDEPEMVGVAVFGVPVRAAVIERVLPGDWRDSLELSRLVLLDRVEANAESWFIARAFRVLRDDGIIGVVSFSDPMPRTSLSGRRVMPGHVGTIYQALSATYVGRSKPGRLLVMPDGTTLHRRSVAKVAKRVRGASAVIGRLVEAGAYPLGRREDPGAWVERWTSRLCRPLRHPGNHKYVWALDRAARRHLPRSLPYPKVVG